MLTLGSSFIQYNEGNDKGTKCNALFFDPISERCCAVQNEATETLFRLSSLDKSCPDVFFSSQKRNQIRSICFSSDLSVAVIQQEDSILDFLLFVNGCVSAEFQQRPKFFKESSFIFGVNWLTDRQLAISTEAGIEFCSLNIHRKSLKLLKSFSHPSSWFICFSGLKLFLLGSSVINNSLHLISFQNNMLFNIGCINVDFGCSSFKPRLLERDVSFCPIYGHVCILILKFEPSNGFASGLSIFEFSDEKQPMALPQFVYLLQFELFGLVGIQVVDNLILIHHKNACKTLVFDIKISTDRFVHSSSIEVTDLLSKSIKDRMFITENGVISKFEYNSAWKMIQYKGFIIDMQFGIFTQVQLDLNKAVNTIENLEDLIHFLINRKDAEADLLALLQRIILRKEINFVKVTRIMRKILYDPEKDAHHSPQNGKSLLFIDSIPRFVSHNSILRCIFEPLYLHPEMDKRYLANLMIDFFLSLKQRKIQIQNHYLPELLLKIVADAKMWTCLHQLLQYRVIDDSKFLAFELISLSEECSSLYQIALDMLNRRGNTDQIAEMLLGRNHVVDALRFANGSWFGERWAIGNEGSGAQRIDIICLKLLAATWTRPVDRPLRYAVYSHLQTAGKLKSLIESNDAGFERFSREFRSLYSFGELKEAEISFRLARLSSIRGRRHNSGRDESFCSANSGNMDSVED